MLRVHLRKLHAPIVASLTGDAVVAVGAMKTTTVITIVDVSTADIIVLDSVVCATKIGLLEAADAWAQNGRRHVGERRRDGGDAQRDEYR